MFSDKNINILAYPLETVLSEKYETIISRGILNTRMRDFYDIYILSTLLSFDTDTFKTALQNTASNRGTANQLGSAKNIISNIASNQNMISLWLAYQKKYPFSKNITWEMTINALNRLTE